MFENNSLKWLHLSRKNFKKLKKHHEQVIKWYTPKFNSKNLCPKTIGVYHHLACSFWVPLVPLTRASYVLSSFNRPTATLASTESDVCKVGPGKPVVSRVVASFKGVITWVVPPPRIPVANEGLGWDSLLKME